MSPDIIIRSLAQDEWQSYKSLRLEALEREPQAFGAAYASTNCKPDDYWRKRLEEVGDSGFRMLFAVKNGIPIGMAACAREDEQVDIISVYVTAAHRGHGIARALMEAILRDIRRSFPEPSAVAVSLWVNKDQEAAVSLYASLGFTVVEENVSVLGDGREHAQYRMKLTQGATALRLPVSDSAAPE